MKRVLWNTQLLQTKPETRGKGKSEQEESDGKEMEKPNGYKAGKLYRGTSGTVRPSPLGCHADSYTDCLWLRYAELPRRPLLVRLRIPSLTPRSTSVKHDDTLQHIYTSGGFSIHPKRLGQLGRRRPIKVSGKRFNSYLNRYIVEILIWLRNVYSSSWCRLYLHDFATKPFVWGKTPSSRWQSDL